MLHCQTCDARDIWTNKCRHSEHPKIPADGETCPLWRPWVERSTITDRQNHQASGHGHSYLGSIGSRMG